MNYKEHTRLDLVAGGNVFKQGDHMTLGFTPRDYEGDVVDLTGKDIEGVIYSRRKGIMFTAPADYVTAEQKIEFTIDEVLDHGEFQIEFTVTDAADPEYRRKFPSAEQDGRLIIKPSVDNMDVVGVQMTTVSQLKNELQGLQSDFESSIVPQVDELKQRVDDGVGAFTEDTEVLDARMGEPNLRAFNEKLTTQLAETEVEAKIAKGALSGRAKIALDIPTYDDNPSITHPDVLHVPEGWNGFRYWMGFTPYPAGSRENPSIVCSNNGRDWEVPEGLTNPIFTIQEATASGYSFWSDTDLVLLPDNRLALYFRGSSGSLENIYRTTSSDGVNWSPRERVIQGDTSEGATRILSPAVIVEDDGSFLMYSVDSTLPIAERIKRRTSSDGVNWSAPTTCTIPTGVKAWHMDAIKAGGKYHLLIASDYTESGRLFYWKSSDGLTFTGSSKPAIPLTGEPEDANGNYRSTFVAKPGNPITFEVWAATWHPATDGVWNIIHLDNVQLENNTFRSEKRIDDLAQSHDSIFIPAKQFGAMTGTPELMLTSFRHQGYKLAKTETQGIAASVEIPKDWKIIRMWILWTTTTMNVTGNVAFTGAFGAVVNGQNMTAAPEWSQSATAFPAPARHALNKTFLMARLTERNNAIFDYITLRRDATNALDTLAGDVSIIGVVLEKTDSTKTPE